MMVGAQKRVGGARDRRKSTCFIEKLLVTRMRSIALGCDGCICTACGCDRDREAFVQNGGESSVEKWI